MIRQAVILAAGKGTRLRAEGDELPKPLHVVGGMPLIKRTILTLGAAGVTKVVVVTGYQAAAVRAALLDPAYAAAGIEVVPVHNADFEKANGISVLVGGGALTGPFMLSMADHMYTPAIARLVASQDVTAADLFLATDVRTKDILDIDDATKVRSEDGQIVEIGKQLTAFDRIDCGVFAVTPRLLEELVRVRAERGDCSLTDGVRRLAEARRARVADIGDELWQDVDTPADRSHAEALFKDRDPLAR
ncbi:MAG: NTP transferase domain-containing protein [Deltaproteobacteria bacterium]|nr:NTP transferase domain-containing protein [Deltaproteobacteria bacterium]